MRDDTVSVPGENADTELMAIRSLLDQATKADAVAVPPVQRTVRRDDSASDRLPPIAPVQEPDVPSGEPAPNVMRMAVAWLWSRVRTYRPQSKNVLLTSLVLLLLLQPTFVLGWLAFAVAVVVACYYAMGGDAFWRKIVELFQSWELRQPQAARRVKLRAFAFSKKWDRHLRKLPDQMADALRLPELRGLLAADARHEEALCNRLNRLQRDGTG